MRLKPHHIALALAALLALPLLADEAKEKAAGKAADKPAAPAAVGMKVHVDPATGQIVSPKSNPDAKGVSAATPAVSAAPLQAENVTAKAGGRKVNLQNRFLMEVVATVGPDGKVTESCNQVPEPAPNPTADSKEPHHGR